MNRVILYLNQGDRSLERARDLCHTLADESGEVLSLFPFRDCETGQLMVTPGAIVEMEAIILEGDLRERSIEWLKLAADRCREAAEMLEGGAV